MPTIRLYHGTAHSFDAFDDGFRRRGTEPNSCLGIHLTQFAALAADYAELANRDNNAGEPVVLVVEVSVSKIGVVQTASDFLGREPYLPLKASRSAVEFVDARQEMMDRGFDGVAVEPVTDDLAGCWVIFDPSKLTIVDRISKETAYDLDDDVVYEDIEFEVVTLLAEETADEMTL